MNKEELLKRLNDIKEQLDVSNISVGQIEANKNYRDVQRQLELEADELLAKISNTSNYEHSVSQFRDRRRQVVEDKMAEIDAEIAKNLATIPASNVTIASRDSEIDAAHFLIDAGRKEITAYSKILKEAQGKNDTDTINKMNDNIHNTELAISDLETETTQNEVISNLAKMDLETANTRNKELENLKKQYAESIQGIDDRVSDTSIIDETKREEDRRKYNKLQEQIRNIDRNYDDNFRTYDFYGNVDSLIAGVTAGTISDEEVLKKAQEIKNNITADFYIYNNENSDRNKKIQQNVKAQEFYATRVSELEAKLNDKDKNYLVSIFEEEVVKDEIDARIKSDEASLISLENQKTAIERKIVKFKDPSDEIQKMMRDLRRLGNDATDEEIAKIQKNLSKLYKSRDNRLAKKIELEKQKENINQEIALVKTRLSNSKKELKEKDEKPILNLAAITADEADLKRSKEMLASLKSRETILNKDLEVELDSLISDLNKNDIKENLVEKEDKKPIPIIDFVKAKTDNLVNKIKNKETWKKVGQWVKKNKIKLTAGVLSAVLLGGIAGCVSNHKDKSENNNFSKQEEVVPDIDYTPQLENYVDDDSIDKSEDVEPITPTTVKETKPTVKPAEKKPVVKPVAPKSTVKPVEPKPVAPKPTPVVITPTPDKPTNDQTLPDMDDDTPTNDNGGNNNSGGSTDNGGSNTDPVNNDDNRTTVTLEVPDNSTFYHLNPDGTIETVSNNDSITSNSAAQDISNQTGLNATGNPGDYKDISSVSNNNDGSMDVTVKQSDSTTNNNSGKTLVDIMRESAGVTEEQVAQQQAEMDAIKTEQATEQSTQTVTEQSTQQSDQVVNEQVQSEGGMTR